MTTNIKFVIARFVFQAQIAPKSVFGRGSAPDPAGGAYDAPPDPLVGWVGGYPLPIPLPVRRLRRLELGAFGVSNSVPMAPRFSGPPQHKILATPVFGSKTFLPENCIRKINKMPEFYIYVIFAGKIFSPVF